MIIEALKGLEKLDFSGKGEAFVESMFITPLLLALGYEEHKDYEVIRHGDDNSSFKLKYPPVEKGAVKVKSYSPDYISTIRKRAFWVIEAKSPKEVGYPFDVKYLVQGLQYCIHPEIQAKYLVVSTGAVTAVYDAHGSVFLGKDIYEPVLQFECSQLTKRWPEIYELLSVEKLRTRIEQDVKAMYDKLALSSLDEEYPAKLLTKIGASSQAHRVQIQKHVIQLQNESMDRERAAWRQEVEQLTPEELLSRMNFPMQGGDTEAQHFVAKSLKSGAPPLQILRHLIDDFAQQSIFRKEQTFVAVCTLYQLIEDDSVRKLALDFLKQFKDADLPLLNQVECAVLRLMRKASVVKLYAPLRTAIAKMLESAPELDRFVWPPTALSWTYESELRAHRKLFAQLKVTPEKTLRSMLSAIESAELSIEVEFKEARQKRTDAEIQILGLEYYGVEGKHYAFKNIVNNFKVSLPGDTEGT